MTAPATLPYAPLLVRDLLILDDPLKAIVGDRISTRSDDASQPYLLVRSAGNVPIESGYSMHQPLVQVDGCCPLGVDGDPELIADAISQAAIRILAGIRNRRARGVAYSIRHVDGPVTPDPDTSRGTESPIYRSITRYELTLRALPAA
jgi:hypothetical protein